MKATAHIVGFGSYSIEVGELKGKEAAELVFCRLNHGSGQEEPGYAGRSMMVGDSVEVPMEDGTTSGLKCAGIGWEPIQWGFVGPKGPVLVR